MTDSEDINSLIEFAFSDSVSISKERRLQLEEKFDDELVATFNSILKDSTWPAEPWTQSSSLGEAALIVEPILREKYPDLVDESLQKILNYACYCWK